MRCSCNSSTPPDFMLVSYLVTTMLLVWKSEFMVLVAYELGNLWVSDLMLVLLYLAVSHYFRVAYYTLHLRSFP